MENIKKQFEEIYQLLESNKNKKVSTLLPQLQELMTAKQKSKNFKKDEDGNITHIFCYYHKEWEALDEVEYGQKSNSATGLTSMCKEGIKHWTKQQRNKKKAESSLIQRMIDGDLRAEDLPAEQARIDEESKVIVPRGE